MLKVALGTASRKTELMENFTAELQGLAISTQPNWLTQEKYINNLVLGHSHSYDYLYDNF